MVNLIRRFQQPLLITITILVIISFAVLYNSDSIGRLNADRVAVVSGHGISLAQYQRGLRKYELASGLGLRELVGSLGMPATSEDTFKKNFVLGSLVLRQEAARLGIATTDEEVADAIKAVPEFQTQGQFDKAKYTQIVQVALGSRGLTEAQLEEIVRDDLVLKKVKGLLGSTLAAAPSEVREAYVRDQQKTVASVVRLKLEDFSKDVAVSDDDAKKAFEERKATFSAPEKRKVKYVALVLPESEKPLTGKDRVDALKGLSEKANDLSQALLDPGAKFDEVAAKLSIPVKESAEFAATDNPAELGASSAVVEAAFQLKPEQPTSDVLGTEKGYYVVHLSNVTPTRPLTLDEAKPKLLEALKQERAAAALNLKGTEIRTKIDAEIKAGKNFADAATVAGAKAEPFPPFSRREPKFDQPDGQEVMISSIDLQPGQMSAFLPTASGGALVFVERREPIDEAKFEQEKAMTAANVARGKRESLFAEWFKARRKEAGIVPEPTPAPPAA
jgi:peptidyl-prolyl cis-trans isomerase D